MMLRSTLFATALLAAIVPGLARAGDEAIAMPTLRANVTVNGDIVHIGDLVENAGAAADVAMPPVKSLGFPFHFSLRLPGHFFPPTARAASEKPITIP